MLLRTFVKVGGRHNAEDFGRDRMPKADEVTLHTWLDANLRELTELVKEQRPEATDRTARFLYAQVRASPPLPPALAALPCQDGRTPLPTSPRISTRLRPRECISYARPRLGARRALAGHAAQRRRTTSRKFKCSSSAPQQ